MKNILKVKMGIFDKELCEYFTILSFSKLFFFIIIIISFLQVIVPNHGSNTTVMFMLTGFKFIFINLYMPKWEWNCPSIRREYNKSYQASL